MENQHRGTETSHVVLMVAVMAGICLLMPLSLIVLGAIGAPGALVIGVVAGLLLLCVFSHRLVMKH